MAFGLRSEKHHGRPLATYVIAAVFFATVIEFMYYYFFQPASQFKPQSDPCGHTPEEARAKGCYYEPMMSAWVPNACFYADLVAEEEEMDDIFSTWEWYTDRDLTQSVTDADALQNLREGNYTKIWTSRDHAHDLHCSAIMNSPI